MRIDRWKAISTKTQQTKTMKAIHPSLTLALLLAAVATGFSQVANTAADAAQESVTGTPGVATRRAVMNFAELPQEPTPSGPYTVPQERTVSAPQTEAASPLPASSFPALGPIGDRPPPPDTMGAVGPNHLMVMLNPGVRIQDRAGGVISTVSISNFWAALGTLDAYYYPNGAPAYGFDPTVLYDPYDNR